jgi:hypothetical protein
MTLILLLLFSFISTVSSDVKLIRENGKVGMADADGKLLIPIEYDELGWSSGEITAIDGVIGFQQSGLWGLISIANKQISDPQYISIVPMKGDKIIAGLKGRHSNKVLYGVLNTNGNAQIGFQYESIVPTGDQLIVSQRINTHVSYGLIDNKERAIIPIEHQKISLVNDQILAATNKANKTALFNGDGISITPFIIDTFEPYSQKFYRFSSNGQIGLFDSQGKIRLPAKYKYVALIDTNTAIATEYDQWEAHSTWKDGQFYFQSDTVIPIAHNLLLIYSGSSGRFINANGELLDSIFYEQIVPLDSNLLLVKDEDAYGVKDVFGKRILDVAYDTIIYSNPFFYTRSQKGWHVYNKFQRKLTSRPLLEILPQGELLIAAREERYWGYLDFTGKVSIGYKYDEAQPFVGEHAVVKYIGGYGVINSFGDWVVSPNHEKIDIVRPNLYLIQNDGFKQLRNQRNELLFETYNAIINHPIGLVEKDSRGKLGFINPMGNSKLGLEYDSISDVLSDQYVILIRDGYYSLVTLDGKIIIPDYSQFEKIFPFTQDFIGMQKDGKYGYSDLEGRLRIANQYEMVGIWQEDRGPVMLKGKWGFVDGQERLVIQPYYDEVSPFVNGVSIARKGPLYGLLDKEGTEVVAFENDLVTLLASGNYLIRKGNKLGLATTSGRHSLGTIYDHLEELAPGLYHVRRRGKSGVKDDGNVDILPLSYDNITYDSINNILFSKTKGAQRTIPLR